jgi:NitT/TauT family transport system ATP-binding protein
MADVILERVRKHYGDVVAVHGVDLRIAPGEFVTLLGPSGCGKTTCLRMVAGFVEPDAGRVLIGGSDVTGTPPYRRNAGMVFQSYALFPWKTVRANVEFGLKMQGKPAAERSRIAATFINMVKLTGFEEHYPAELSGGMQQRVNLARALLTDPEMLLLDEPFAALDAQTREMMQLELLKIWNRDRKTALFITHDIKEAIYLADRVIVFTKRPGRVKSSIDVDIPRPRDLRVKRDPKFVRYEDEIWESIQEELATKPERLLAGMPA